ncbi:hypothetical protein N7455_008737 [Penicillium solitum]|uniref:uncharacterized protein n=1 Tax=Penicillium solitum TaxID=60172 RepID=UPI0032C44B4C|nr:hypothetical protein N7455_008737 [Penicillium solitum]
MSTNATSDNISWLVSEFRQQDCVSCLKCPIRISGTSPTEIHFQANEIWNCSLPAVSGPGSWVLS